MLFAEASMPPEAKAQPTEPRTFEVASIKPSPLLDYASLALAKVHIGISIDQARVDIGQLSLLELVCVAYSVKPYQVMGNLDWMTAGMSADRFDIIAKMPDGATKDQVPEMLKSLLMERFNLMVHQGERLTAVYSLIQGRGGPKLTEARPDPPSPSDTNGAATSGVGEPPEPSRLAPAPFSNTDTKLSMAKSGTGIAIGSQATGTMRLYPTESGVWRMEGEKVTMDMLATSLSQYLDRPVVDRTELKGKYRVSLDLSKDTLLAAARRARVNVTVPEPSNSVNSADNVSEPPGGSLFSSIQQLGLKLEPKRLSYKFLVIDHVERKPSVN